MRMSSSKCVIPVPPPLLPTMHSKSNVYSPFMTRKMPIECQWAIQYPDLQKASILAHVCTSARPKHYRIKLGIRSIIQEGPTCGLAALAMVAAADTPMVTDILQVAKEREYTNHGEMFSTKNMLQLADSIFKTIGKPYVSFELYVGQLDSGVVKNALVNGACIMVAYDSDFNHAPCLKNGDKAHWALLTGYLVDNNDKFYVFSRHGKTKNLALWSLDSLSASNSNLNQYTAPQRYDEYRFQLPADGISGKNGLKNQCILITGLRDLNELHVSTTS